LGYIKNIKKSIIFVSKLKVTDGKTQEMHRV